MRFDQKRFFRAHSLCKVPRYHCECEFERDLWLRPVARSRASNIKALVKLQECQGRCLNVIIQWWYNFML